MFSLFHVFVHQHLHTPRLSLIRPESLSFPPSFIPSSPLALVLQALSLSLSFSLPLCAYSRR